MLKKLREKRNELTYNDNVMNFSDSITSSLKIVPDKIFSSKYFSPRVKSALVILSIGISVACLLTFVTFMGIIFSFIGIGLLMLLAEFIFLLILIFSIIISLFRSKENKDIEIGLLLSIVLTVVWIYHIFNPNAW